MQPPEDLRRRVLTTSLELIASDGLEAFSMREVARRAGVSHQAPYHYFADREAILAAIVAEGFAQLRADMLAALDEAGSAPDARFKAIGMAYIRFVLARPGHFKLMFRSEWVRAEHHGEADACAHAAFDVLTSIAGEAAAARGAQADMSLILGAWSLVHGFSTLALEGKLARHVGDGEAAYLEAASAMLDRFLSSAARG